MNNHLIVGCSFTDPSWQLDIPWSIEYAKTHPSYVVARAEMGIKGICTEAMYYLSQLNVSRVIIMLPTMWRLDIEMDIENQLCNAMVDLLYADQTWEVSSTATRKWIVSGGLHYPKNTKYASIFDFLYQHQGFLVIAKEHLRALTQLLEYCKLHNIEYAITAIQDPLAQLTGIEYLKNDICELLDQVEYNSWIRFDGKFIDQYLGHARHPCTREHQDLCNRILEHFN